MRLRISVTLYPLSRSGSAADSSASAAAANASAAAGAPGRTSSATRARHGRDATPPKASRALRTIRPRRRGRRRSNRWRRRRTRARGPSGSATAATPRRRQGDRGDQRAGRQRRLQLRRVTDGQVELRQRQLARTVERLVAHDRVERGQRDRHVRGMGGHAVTRPAEDRVVVVLAVDRGTTAAGGALVARLRGVGEVAAAGALQQVPADRGHVAQLSRRAGEHGLAQRRVAAPHLGMGGEVAVGRRRADDEPAVGASRDPVERQRRTSTSRVGASTPAFIRSTRLVPPPR